MSRPQNFLEADSSFRDQNLRFVRNNLESNINQFFGGGVGGGGGGGSGNSGPSNVAPPRNFKIVQPSPEFEQRNEFFLQLGLSHSEATLLSNRSFCSQQFNLNYFRDKRHQLRKSRLKQTDADAKIVNEISVTIAELERQASNFGGGSKERRDGGNFGGGFNGGGNLGVFNGPRGFDGRGGGNPENFTSIGGPVSGSFVGNGPGNFDGRGGGSAVNLFGRGGGFQENFNNRSGDGLGLLDNRGTNTNRNLGERGFDASDILDSRRGNNGNFDGRSAAPGIWDDKRGGGQQNFDRNFIGNLDSGSGNFGNRGDDGSRNFNNRGDDGSRNFNNRGDDGSRNFNNRGDGPGNLGNMGNGGPGNFNNRGDGPGNLGNMGNGGPGNFNNRGDGPGNLGNMGNGGPGNFGKRGDDGPRNFNNRGDGLGNLGNMGNAGPGNFGNRGDGLGNFGNKGNCGPENFGKMGDGGPGNFGNRDDGPRNFGNRGDCGPENFGNRSDGNFDLRWSGDPKNFNIRGDGAPGPFLGGPRGFDSNDGGGPRGGFDGREGIGLDNFDNRKYNSNSTTGDQGRLNNEVAGESGFNKQFEEIFTRRAPTPPRNIDWNDRKRPFPGDVNDGPPSSVLRNDRNMNDFPRQLNLDDFNRRRSPQPNMNQRNFDQFGGGGNINQGNNELPFTANNNRVANISNSTQHNFDSDQGRVGNIGKQNTPVSFGGLIYANNMNRNQTSVGNASSIGRSSLGGNNANQPNNKGILSSGNNLNSTATSGNVVDRSRNSIKQNPPIKSGAQVNNKVNANAQSSRAVVANNSNNNNNRNKAALNAGNIGGGNNSSQNVNVVGSKVGDSDVTKLNRNIPKQPNNSNTNSQRRNLSQISNKPNSSQSIGNVERGNRNPTKNIPSLMSNTNIFGFGNRGPNDNFNNNNFGGGGAGFQERNNNFNNFTPMNVDRYQSNPGGFCIKSFKVNTNEKYFVNVCQTDEIPAPEDLTEEQLSEILNSETPSNYRIPMSISEPRTTKDKSNNVVEVCDIAVNPKFFVKCKKSVLFKDFFLALIAEALSEKYNVQISIEKTIILATRKFIGSLVSHRVRNNDVQKVLQSFQNPTEDDKAKLEHLEQLATSGAQRSLVQEIDAKEISTLQKFNEQIRAENAARNKKEISMAASREPLYKLRAKIKNEQVDEIQAEFYLPKCITSQEITLDIGEDRILIESMKHGYLFDKFVNYRLNQQRARAIYDKTNKMLQLRIPVLAAD